MMNTKESQGWQKLPFGQSIEDFNKAQKTNEQNDGAHEKGSKKRLQIEKNEQQK